MQDNLELSDDSDIEVHPNVDKRSFIRAKQAQIHNQREERKHQIKTLKYERIINDGLISRIDLLLTALKSHKPSASDDNADVLVFQALIESAGDAADDQPPPPEEGVHENVKEQPTYSEMMASLVDQVKKAVEERKPTNRLEGYMEEIGDHRKKIQGLQGELNGKLADLEKEEKRFITSDDIHTGFDYSNVQKSSAQAAGGKPSENVELLNPSAAKRDGLQRTDTGQSSGADADVEDGTDPYGTPVITDLGRAFADLPPNNYRAYQQFLMAHPTFINEYEQDGLLMEAFNALLDGKEEYARMCVHQGLLVQYCRQLGIRGDGLAMFFKRITTKDHPGQKLFLDDVASTYDRVRSRVVELKANQQKDLEEGGVEQIQLHAVDPNTTINIRIPPPITDNSTPEDRSARDIFDSFPPGLRRALESGSLDRVNNVLGKMSVSEAEEIVEKLGDGKMLSLEEGVIDATNDEGRRMVEQIEQTGRMPGKTEEMERVPEGLSKDPPTD